MIKVQPSNLTVRDTFIASRTVPVIQCVPGVSAQIYDSHLHYVGFYVPPLFRRPRLRRFVPLAVRWQALRAFAGWLA